MLSIDQGDPLVERKVIDDMFKRILNGFPDSCMNGDIKFLRSL